MAQSQEKTMTKWKSNLKSLKSQNVGHYYGKNWSLIRIYLIIIITVIIEIIVKMIVMLMNKDKNK